MILWLFGFTSSALTCPTLMITVPLLHVNFSMDQQDDNHDPLVDPLISSNRDWTSSNGSPSNSVIKD